MGKEYIGTIRKKSELNSMNSTLATFPPPPPMGDKGRLYLNRGIGGRL